MSQPDRTPSPNGGRLSSLDGSFLRTESASAHMHVGWTAIFAPANDRDRPTLTALRERMIARVDELPWCRWKLQSAPLGFAEHRWVRDTEFDPAAHLVAVSDPEEPVTYDALAELRDRLLSEPLDHARPMWQMYFVPRLQDGRVGLIGKVHHALVDGMAALQIVGLILDTPARATSPSAAVSPQPSGHPSSRPRVGVALGGRLVGTLLSPAARAAVLVRTTASVTARPDRAARAAGRVLEAVRQDLLPRAPDSILNVPVGPQRTLVGYHASRQDLRRVRATGVSLNDIGLTVVAGALRALAIEKGDEPTVPFKAMVPVNLRPAGDNTPGNRIAMIYIQLPVDLPSPAERLDRIRAETLRLKASRRPENMQTLYETGGLVPAPLRSPIAKAISSARVFNLTISQSPGPRGVVRMLGSEMQEVYSVVPIPDGHALAIGMVRYRHELFIGCYADPRALPEVEQLPALMEKELQTLSDQAALPLVKTEAETAEAETVGAVPAP